MDLDLQVGNRRYWSFWHQRNRRLLGTLQSVGGRENENKEKNQNLGSNSDHLEDFDGAVRFPSEKKKC